MEEIWKEIPGYEGYYEVSNHGQVRSLDRMIKNKKGFYLKKGQIIKPHIWGHGYNRISLHKNRKYTRHSVHILVANVYITKIKDKPIINHKDGNKINNHVDNLEWVTHQENRLHAAKTGLNKGPIGEKQHLSKLTRDDVVQIRKLRNSGIEYGEISKLYNVTKMTIRCACTGKTWKHVDYPFSER
jgi:hypothetical protein